jgi:hypothetical protein
MHFPLLLFSMTVFCAAALILLNAGRVRSLTLRYFKASRTLYRIVAFADWIQCHPRAHLWLIRITALWICLLAAALFIVSASHPGSP